MEKYKRSSGVTWHKFKYLHLSLEEESQWEENIEEEIEHHTLLLNINENNIDALLKLAKLMRQKKDFPQSDSYYKEILEINPKNNDALNGLGWNRLLLHETEEAEKYFIKVITRDSDNFFALLHLGWTSLLQNDPPKTKRYASKLVQLYPKYSYAWIQLGWSQQFLGTGNEVEKSYMKALELDSANFCACEDLGNYYFNIDKFKALIYFKKLAELAPQVPDSWSYLGEIQILTGSIEDAIDSFIKEFELDEKRFDAVENLALLYAITNDYSQSTRFIRLLEEFDPDYSDGAVWIWYDGLFKDYNAIEKILKCLNKLVPDSGYIYQSLGRVYEYQNELKEAVRYYKELIRVDPEYSDGWRRLSLAQVKSGHKEQALKSARKSFEIDNLNYEALEELGKFFRKEGKYQEAIEIFEELIQYDSKYSFWWETSGCELASLNQFKEAQESFSKAFNLYEIKSYAMFDLAELYALQGNYGKAYPLCKMVSFKQSNRSKVWHLLAHILKAMGEHDEAKICSQRAHEIDKNELGISQDSKHRTQ